MFQQGPLFSTSYGSIHVACEIHLEQNCRQQMRVLGIQKQTMDGFIVDIFGEEDVATRIRYGGIVDSRNQEAFEDQVNAVRERWDYIWSIWTQKRHRSSGSGFIGQNLLF